MKKLIYLLLALFIMGSCNTENKQLQYTIKVNIDTPVDGTVYLQKRVDGEWIKTDTAVFADNIANMTGVLDYPEMNYVYIESIKRSVPVFLDKGDIEVKVFKDDYGATEVSGSPAQVQYDAFKDEMGVYDDEMRAVYKEYRALKDSGLMEQAEKLSLKLDEMYEKQQEFVKEYVYTHNSDLTTPFIVNSNSYSWSVGELDSIVDNFEPALHASPEYKTLTDRIAVLKRVDIGQPLLDFAMKDTNDVDVKLSEVSKGKYMLVDFWASWCGPCRAENPNIVACYRDFHEKGFDVLGVSFDKDRGKWIEAIYADSLYWNHVSDLEYWNNAAGKMYGIRSIPSSILLDPDGIIIAKNLRGEELRAKLEELLN